MENQYRKVHWPCRTLEVVQGVGVSSPELEGVFQCRLQEVAKGDKCKAARVKTSANDDLNVLISTVPM